MQIFTIPADQEKVHVSESNRKRVQPQCPLQLKVLVPMSSTGLSCRMQIVSPTSRGINASAHSRKTTGRKRLFMGKTKVHLHCQTEVIVFNGFLQRQGGKLNRTLKTLPMLPVKGEGGRWQDVLRYNEVFVPQQRSCPHCLLLCQKTPTKPSTSKQIVTLPHYHCDLAASSATI